ncbi:MAG: hypothetical protein RIQ60_44 [Pseudomonadota bacterium]|jgi:predicted ATPase/DNA-binding winged helix-turn-helix (wHTH) protein
MPVEPVHVPSTRLRFGRVEIEPDRRALLVDGVAQSVGARAFDLLLVLVQRRERIVSKNELLEQVWPGMVVEENNLPVHVSALRKLLGQDAIATIPGRGYRFTLLDSGVSAPTPALSTALSTAPSMAPDAALVTAPPASAPAVSPAASLPMASGRFDLPSDAEPIIGREEEVYDIVDLLGQRRLVNIVGAGGMGKTRLARAVMRRLREDFDDGVWWVDLAPLATTDGIAATIARTIGLADWDAAAAAGLPQADLDDAPARLARCLATRSRMLLVLDNCEHLAATVARQVAELISQLPMLRMLLTSRIPLHLATEQVWRLEALAQPAVGASLAQARACPAFELFETRARACDRRFVIDDTQLAPAIDLCRRLEGHALSIEMAAARAPQLGLGALLARLGERLRMLRNSDPLQPQRQSTLRATLDWSCSLLDDTQRAVLRRIAVFTGWFDLPLAQRVAADDDTIDAWAVLDALAVLVDHSLVQMALPAEAVDDGDPLSRPASMDPTAPRYRLPETTRLYGLELLAASADEAPTRARWQQLRALRHEVIAVARP